MGARANLAILLTLSQCLTPSKMARTATWWRMISPLSLSARRRLTTSSRTKGLEAEMPDGDCWHGLLFYRSYHRGVCPEDLELQAVPASWPQEVSPDNAT